MFRNGNGVHFSVFFTRVGKYYIRREEKAHRGRNTETKRRFATLKKDEAAKNKKNHN